MLLERKNIYKIGKHVSSKQDSKYDYSKDSKFNAIIDEIGITQGLISDIKKEVTSITRQQPSNRWKKGEGQDLEQ